MADRDIHNTRDLDRPPIVIIAGRSDSGKTSLLEKLLPEFKKRGHKVGTIKHHHGALDFDRPGKDSWRHKKAGAEKSIISSPNQIGIVMAADHDHRPEELIPFLSGVDLILAEGYKGENLPKVEIFRPEVHDRPLCLEDQNLIAMITDSDLQVEVPKFALDDTEGLADFLIGTFALKSNKH